MPIQELMKLKYNLKRILNERDMTVSQLGRLTGVPKTSLSDWLAGGNPRDLNKVKLVADAFKITVDQLCFGDGIIVMEPIERHLDEIHAGLFEVVLRRPKK